MQIFVTMEEKVLSFGKLSAVTTEGQGSLTFLLGLLKMSVLKHHVMTRKPTMMQKGITTFNPTHWR